MRLRTRRDRRPGAAAAELAFLLPFLMFIGVITTDWARVMYYTITLENATRAGALYACDPYTQQKSPYYDPNVQTGAQNAAQAESSDLGSAVTVSSVSSSTDAAGNPAVAVTATIQFKTITGFSYGQIFGVENSATLSRTVQMRVLPSTTK
jgi:Flp pilus assembly protein TadG